MTVALQTGFERIVVLWPILPASDGSIGRIAALFDAFDIERPKPDRWSPPPIIVAGLSWQATLVYWIRYQMSNSYH